MKSVNIAALAALLSAGAQAVPMAGHNQHAKNLHAHMHHAKRDIVWITEFEIEVVTVVKTVYGDGSEPTESASSDAPVETPAAITVTSYDAPEPTAVENPTSAEAAPTTSSTTSETYVAPAPVPTSSETYVAPAPAPTSTSDTYVAPAPVPTTSAYVAPVVEPTTYAAVPTTPAAAYSPPASSGSGVNPGGPYTGEFTYWEPAMGACGWTNTADEDVVAISMVIFDRFTPGGNPNNNPLCGMTVTLTGKDGNKYPAKVVDRCVGCVEGDLDLTQQLFNKATSNGDGRVAGMSWSFNA